MRKFPRGVAEKSGRLFGRVYTKKGGEISFPLGAIGTDAGAACQKFYATRAAIRVAEARGLDENDIKAAIREGTFSELMAPVLEHVEPELTVAQTAERWLRERVCVEMEARNASMIRSRVEASLLPCLGPNAIRSIRRTECHSYVAYLRSTRPELAASTLHHYLRDLRELLNWAEEVELIDSNPWPKRRILPRVQKRPPDRLTDREVTVLIGLPSHWGFTLRFLLSTGLRWGEACRARRRDIENHHLLVRKSKSGKPRRVPLSKAILIEIVRRGGDWIVPTQRKAPGGRAERSSSSFNATIRRLAGKHLETLPLKERKALEGLARFHAHQTRHTFASRYVEARGTLTMLQEILGHASMDQTQQYGRPDATAIQADADQVFERWAAANSRFYPGIAPIR